MDELMTAREAAADLGLSPVTIRRAFREGRLYGKRVGRGKGWSVILVDPRSIAVYRAKHLGRRGPRRKAA